MTVYKTKDICSALKKKGFSEDTDSHHIYYRLFYNGKKTEVHTFISHGLPEYGDSLIGKMKKQLCLQSKTEFQNLIECPMTKEEYINLLIQRGNIH